MRKFMYPLVLYIFIFIVWTSYRYLFSFPEWIDEILIKPILWLAPTYLVVANLEKSRISDYIEFRGAWTKQAAVGIGIGVFMGLQRLIGLKVGNPHIGFNPFHFSVASIVLQIFLTMFTATTEEFVFRGYFYRRIKNLFGSAAWGMGVSACLFAALHVPVIMFVLHYSPAQLISYLVVLIAFGLVESFTYEETKSLTPCIISHALWNVSNILIG